MKKWIFLFLAIALVPILPTIMANDRAGPEPQAQFTSSTVGTIEASGCAIATTHTIRAATWIKDDFYLKRSIRTDEAEAQIINIITPSSFVSDERANITVILDEGAQKTKFPSLSLSAEVIANHTVRTFGLSHLRV